MMCKWSGDEGRPANASIINTVGSFVTLMILARVCWSSAAGGGGQNGLESVNQADNHLINPSFLQMNQNTFVCVIN